MKRAGFINCSEVRRNIFIVLLQFLCVMNRCYSNYSVNSAREPYTRCTILVLINLVSSKYTKNSELFFLFFLFVLDFCTGGGIWRTVKVTIKKLPSNCELKLDLFKRNYIFKNVEVFFSSICSSKVGSGSNILDFGFKDLDPFSTLLIFYLKVVSGEKEGG